MLLQVLGFVAVCGASLFGLGYFVANAIEQSNEEIWEYNKEE